MKKLLISAVVGAALLLLVATVRYRPRDDKPEVYEAVVRYYLTKPRVVQTKVLFVQINEQDPAADFLERFKGSGVDVREGSGAQGLSHVESGETTRDTITGEQGVVLRMGEIDKAIVVSDSPSPGKGRTVLIDPLGGSACSYLVVGWEKDHWICWGGGITC
jgi:hypothetical protein